MKRILLSFATVILGTASLCPAQQSHVMLNQVGYRPSDPKLALVRTQSDIGSLTYEVIDASTSQAVLSGSVGSDRGAYCGFAHHFEIPFTSLEEPGTYRIRLSDGTLSVPFSVGYTGYRASLHSILRFLKVQRCGNADPLHHDPCHLDDGVVQPGPPTAGQSIDVSGGWHDAGDYIKFLLTTSYTVDLLLLAYERYPTAFPDEDGDGIPDVLKEARHGLEWMRKMWDPVNNVLYHQVGSEADHNQGIRMPENDPLSNRPVYACDAGQGANLAGRCAAAFALAKRIWGDAGKPHHDATFAAACETAAVGIYAFGKANEAIQYTIPSYFYQESDWRDDMALGAIELYRVTGQASYLQDARSYATAAGSAWWFNWSSINGLTHYEMARHDPDPSNFAAYKGYIQNDLSSFQGTANGNPFRVAVPYVWGSSDAQMGAALEALLYKDLTGETTYDALLRDQVDYVLGRNQWGVCWLAGSGADDPDDMHHQVSRITGEKLVGAFAEGGAEKSVFDSMGITLSEPDEYAAFQSSTAVYHDDFADYVTNEPTIGACGSLSFVLASLAFPTADLDFDGEVNAGDLGGVMSRWGSAQKPSADIDQDGAVDADDLSLVAQQWQP